MSGLPRSGSTLLSAILNQNPNIHSGPSSPVLSTMFVIENHLNNDELFCSFPKIQQGKNIISSVMSNYYDDQNKEVIIDKNRSWPSKIYYIEEYLKIKAKIICPVRDIDEILSSFIRMIKRNPYQEGQDKINFIDEQLIKMNISINDFNRCEHIAGPQGILGKSLKSIIDCIESGYLDRLHFVEYKDLINEPKKTMQKIYNFLEENFYDHLFDNIKNDYRELDLETYGLKDMHEVKKTLIKTFVDPKDILPNNILEKCVGMNIWRKYDNNQKIIGIK